MRKLLSLTGILLAGDALAYFVGGNRHVRVWSWRRAPRLYRRALRWSERHREATSAFAIGEALTGILLMRAAGRGATA